MKKILIAIALFMIVTGSNQLKAQNGNAGINTHQAHQHHRIKQGVRSGELTHREARHLKAQQGKIRHAKRIAKADGVVTPNEKAHIKNEQARASRKIYKQKHDRQNR